MSIYEVHKSPSHFIKKRFQKNKPAVVSTIYIIALSFVAVLGYLIMPDDSHFANDGLLEVPKKPPMFTVKVLKQRKNIHIPTPSVFEKIIEGEENRYQDIPIVGDPIIERDSVFFIVYPGLEKRSLHTTTRLELSLPLIDVVKSIYASPSQKLGINLAHNYVIRKDDVIYLDGLQNVRTVSKQELLNEFNEKCLQMRTFVLGTDKIGRDVLSRLIFGTRVSLTIGFISLIISLSIGILIGATSGYFGGVIDRIAMWLMTITWSIPAIMLVVAVRLAIQSEDIWVTFVAVGITMWVDVARVVRGQILSIKQKDYIEATKALGFSNYKIIMHHILPNILGPLAVICASNFASAILIEAGLSFLGLGGPPTMPSWGTMIKEGLSELTPTGHWHLIIFPCLAISLTVLAFNLIGNGLRDAYDPHSNSNN
ncbi:MULTISPECIES: ABC transporter permease [Flammeovirga]|uniref:ABC transporter permease n=1 Tax=Flammeovirga agarivorans TaxID=2726742 RepID=A0A7X8XUJ9_9BACT|nr:MULTISPECIES: ABC transporter permease [Flammeovirga]NLR90421.1 ABC transporter permease [Flammeovirga agarivorans]